MNGWRVSPRRAYHFLAWVVWPGCGLPLMVLAATVWIGFFAALVVLAGVLQYLTSHISCPTCHRRIGWGNMRIGRIRIPWARWNPIVQRCCPKCGTDLSQPANYAEVFRW